MSDVLTPVEDLSLLALDVEAVWFDWSAGNWPEGWDFTEAPDCPDCGDYATWVSERFQWECPGRDCEHEGEVATEELDGPMMNYFYPLPDEPESLEEAASLIRMLPLCVVRITSEMLNDPRGESVCALALTGGGMDLSWEICEAFMQFGYLPPVHFAELPGMAGRPRGDVDRWVVAGCKRAWTVYAERAGHAGERALKSLDGMLS